MDEYKATINILNNVYSGKNLNEEFIEIFNQKVVYIQNELSKDKVKSIKIISFFDDEYPIQLTLLKNPPLFLFCRGNTILLKNMKNDRLRHVVQ